MDERREINPEPKATEAKATNVGAKVELSGRSACEVRFVGEPILAMKAETNNLSAPLQMLSHPLVASKFFFALPSSLLTDILVVIDERTVDPDLLTLEQSLSEICGDHAASVGFWNGQAFPYGLLRSGPMKRPSVEESNSLGWDMPETQLANTMRLIEERLEPFAKVSRAYAGWLLTNLEFVTEHDALLTQYSDMVKRWGLGQLGLLPPRRNASAWQ